MAEDSNGPSVGDDNGSSQNRDGTGLGRQILLEEARTTTNQQLAQLNKLDDEAVRTVRIALVLSGLLVGGAKFLPLLNFGLFGALGTLSLVGSLVMSLFVYGTTRPFVGSRPDELSIDYSNYQISVNSYVEILARYEKGMIRNQRILYSNGFFLGIARMLLALAVVFFLMDFVSLFTDSLLWLSTLVWRTNTY